MSSSAHVIGVISGVQLKTITETYFVDVPVYEGNVVSCRELYHLGVAREIFEAGKSYNLIRTGKVIASLSDTSIDYVDADDLLRDVNWVMLDKPEMPPTIHFVIRAPDRDVQSELDMPTRGGIVSVGAVMTALGHLKPRFGNFALATPGYEILKDTAVWVEGTITVTLIIVPEKRISYWLVSKRTFTIHRGLHVSLRVTTVQHMNTAMSSYVTYRITHGTIAAGRSYAILPKEGPFSSRALPDPEPVVGGSYSKTFRVTDFVTSSEGLVVPFVYDTENVIFAEPLKNHVNWQFVDNIRRAVVTSSYQLIDGVLNKTLVASELPDELFTDRAISIQLRLPWAFHMEVCIGVMPGSPKELIAQLGLNPDAFVVAEMAAPHDIIDASSTYVFLSNVEAAAGGKKRRKRSKTKSRRSRRSARKH